MEIVSGPCGVVRRWEASARVVQDAPREEASNAHSPVRLAQRWQKRGRPAQGCCGRTSPCVGQLPCVHASGEREGVYPWRRPLRRYPSPGAASTSCRVRAGGGGFPPSPGAHAGTPATPPPAGPALEPWGEEQAQAVGSSPAAGAAPDILRAAPGGPGSRATPQGGDAGSRRAGSGAGPAGCTRRPRGASAVGGCHARRLSTERSLAHPLAPAGDAARAPRGE